MNPPIESGWYWAMIDGEWEVVWFNHGGLIARAAYALGLPTERVQQWGERIQRKEVES